MIAVGIDLYVTSIDRHAYILCLCLYSKQRNRHHAMIRNRKAHAIFLASAPRKSHHPETIQNGQLGFGILDRE
jgi:hypothetical protein